MQVTETLIPTQGLFLFGFFSSYAQKPVGSQKLSEAWARQSLSSYSQDDPCITAVPDTASVFKTKSKKK